MKKNFFPLLILFSCIVNSSYCQDRLFTYTYQSNVLQKGQREFEVWNTLHSGRTDYYRAFKNRFEVELGLGSNLQTSFYLNLKNVAAETKENGISTLNTGFSMSFSNEWKYKLSDPVANSIGSAIYGEFSISHDEMEFEGKIILDKSIGQTLQALNLIAEAEFENTTENGELETESNIIYEADYGFAYRVAKNLQIGFELNNRNKTNKENGWESSVLYGGPGISFAMEKGWINFSFLPQLAGLYYYKDGYMENGKLLTDYEKLEARLVFSCTF